VSYTKSSAEILRDELFNNWSLSDPLEKVNETTPVSGRQYVYFFDRAQIVKNEKAKALVVEKIVHEGDENRVVHPKFIEQADIYEITLYLRVTSVNPDQFDVWLLNMDNMAAETIRILKTVYDPTSQPPTGVFFQASSDWVNEDIYTSGAQPELRRRLRFRLTRIASPNPEVFEGFGGVLIFDVSTSQGNNLPASDYIYTEAYNIQSVYGIPQIAEPITSTKIPVYFTGIFEGRFNCDMYLKSSDIGNGTHQINNIGNVLANGEVGEVVLLQQYNNTESNSKQVTVTTKLKIISSNLVGNVEQLLQFSLVGEIIEYPTLVVA